MCLPEASVHGLVIALPNGSFHTFKLKRIPSLDRTYCSITYATLVLQPWQIPNLFGVLAARP